MRQAIFDTETTGLGSGSRIVSLAAVEMVDGVLTGAFCHWHLNPERPCEPGATKIHGLTDEYLATQPLFASVKADLMDFIGDSRIVAHNAKYDMRMLADELIRLYPPTKRWDPVTMLPPVTCTFEKAEAKRGRAKGRNTLDTLAREWGVQNLRELTGKHGALVDCLVLFGVFRSLAGLAPAPLVQSQIDHYLSKGFGVHGSFSEQDPGSTGVPSPAEPHPASVGADVCPVG